MFLQVIVSIFAIILIGTYIKFKRSFKFWELKSVPYLEPIFPTGNIIEVIKAKVHFGYVMQDIYTIMKKRNVGDFCGIFCFNQPVLLVMKPDYAKVILVKDFNYFVDRGIYYNEEVDPLSANLFFLEGHRWKSLRAKLTPTFTSGKLKQIFPTLYDVGLRLVNYISKRTGDIEVYDLLARFNTDVISSCAFGFEANSMENPGSKFRTMGKRMIKFSKLKLIKISIAMIFQNIAKTLGVRFTDEDVSEFFMNLVQEKVEYRKTTGYERKDFMQLLIELMDGTSNGNMDSKKLTFNEIAAQAFAFYFAGFEPASTTSTFALHLLAYHPEIQDKARKIVNEILEKHDNKWSYDAIMEMTYLDQIIDETLRLYPPQATIHRTTTKEYTLPNGETIPENTGVIIPNLAFSRDAEYFPDPLKFDPDRFSDENKKNINPFASLPFGEGPRICIGMKFGMLEIKIGLGMLLEKFKFQPCSRTDYQIEIDNIGSIYGPKGDVWLNITSIN